MQLKNNIEIVFFFANLFKLSLESANFICIELKIALVLHLDNYLIYQYL